MEANSQMPSHAGPALRVFGVGDTGLSVIQLLLNDGLSPELFAAVNTGGPLLENSTAAHKLRLENKRLRGLGSGGDPERGRQAAEEQTEQLKALCDKLDIVFIVAGLGGGSGTGICPVLARIAKSAGALVLAFITIPFECEGNHRQLLAEHGLEELRDTVDGIICLPNQKIFNLIEQNTSVIDTFKISNRFLADGVLGLWHLLAFKGLIQVDPGDLVQLLQGHHSECAFAVAEASGPERANQVMQKLLAHPMLDGGEALGDCDSLLVSLTGGPGLTMAEVNLVMDQIKGQCGSAELLMGAVIDESFQERLAVTVVASKKREPDVVPRGSAESLHAQLLDRSPAGKHGSRFLPPPPTLPPDQIQKMLARQKSGRPGGRRTSLKLRQTQLPLEIVSKGRFDKSEPTIHKGEDLDVPTYLRRGVPLN